jgi:hypothetical protein
MATIVGGPFVNWIEYQISKRNEEFALKGDHYINLEKGIFDAFQKSNHISSKAYFPLGRSILASFV